MLPHIGGSSSAVMTAESPTSILVSPVPVIKDVIAGDGQVTINWFIDQDGFSEGEAIDKLLVHKYRKQNDEWKQRGVPHNVTLGCNSYTSTGLNNGAHYRFAVSCRVTGASLSPHSVFSTVVVPNPKLPEPWLLQMDDTTKKNFYFNPVSRERKWQFPRSYLAQLSPETAKSIKKDLLYKLDAMFVEVDVDASGEIDENELKTLVEKQSGNEVSRKQLKALMREADIDGKGTIDFDEFVRLMKRVYNGELEDFTSMFQKATKLAHTAKKLLGWDHSEEIKHKQRMELKNKMGNWTLLVDPIMKTEYYFNEKTNETSWTMPDEIKWYVPPNILLRFEKKQIAAFRKEFASFDIDKSGSIDIDELTEVLQALGQAVSHRKVVKMIKQVDGNMNGQVEFNEFVTMLYEMETGKRNKFNLGKLHTRVFGGDNPLAVGQDETSPDDDPEEQLPPGKAKNHSDQTHKNIVDRSVSFRGVRTLAGLQASGLIVADPSVLKDVFARYRNAHIKLRCKTQTLRGELRERRLRTMPREPIDFFLEDLNLSMYLEACLKLGVHNTADLYARIDDRELYNSILMMKVGHRRKLKRAVRELSREDV